MCDIFQVILNSLVMKHRAVITQTSQRTKKNHRRERPHEDAAWCLCKPRKRHSSGTDSPSCWTSSLQTVRNCVCCFALLVRCFITVSLGGCSICQSKTSYTNYIILIQLD